MNVHNSSKIRNKVNLSHFGANDQTKRKVHCAAGVPHLGKGIKTYEKKTSLFIQNYNIYRCDWCKLDFFLIIIPI